MIWVIYRRKDKLEAPKAIPFDNDSTEIVEEWIDQRKNEYEILDVALGAKKEN